MLTCALELRLSCSVSACKLLWTFACSGTQFGEQWQDGDDVGLHASTSQEKPLYAFIKRLFTCLGAVAQLPEHAKILGFRDELRGDYAHAMPYAASLGCRAIRDEMVGTHGMKETE